MSKQINANTTEVGAHYWFGQWVDDQQLASLLACGLADKISHTLGQSFPFEQLLMACQGLSDDLVAQGQSYQVLTQYMSHLMDTDQTEAILQQLQTILSPDYLQTKLRSELGTERPNVLERRYPDRQYEMWTPIGCVVHVMPSNVFAVAALGLIEGLLANNLNIVKLSARDSSFAALFAQELARHDISQQLLHYMAVLRLPSAQDQLLNIIFKHADAVSAWGGEKAIESIRKRVPAHVRVVAWGHKVSFGYLAQSQLTNNQAITAFAHDVCVLDQQACSSPQTLFVEANNDELVEVAQRLALALAQVSPTIPAEAPDMAALAEITTVLSVARAEQALGLCQIIESPKHDWRIIVDFRAGLKPSPLYRTIWLKPIERHAILSVLRPMRAWLQTCGLAADFPDAALLSQQLLAAGVSRITRPGQMVASYNGAPHDGVYALQQLMRRVSVDVDESFSQVGSFAQLAPLAQIPLSKDQAILDKTGFQAMTDAHNDPQTGVVVRSGGSSGNPAYSQYRWSDYALQMKETGHGLVAAGLDPKHDVVMNLFAAGQMYGSFISFWTILEHVKVKQLPMGQVVDYALVVDEIIRHKATALVGMTPHLLGLFIHEGERLRAYGGLKKLFYGGEGLSQAQMSFLQNQAGISIVRSAAYGSNDAGPMGYQCEASQGGVHHLMSSLQQMEIIDLESDEPVVGNAVGRLILTSRARVSPKVMRYEIGDMGRWVDGPCPCGRSDPRFELMGRLGDVFKAGSPFLNYTVFLQLLSQAFNYAGRLQVHIYSVEAHTQVVLWVDDSLTVSTDQVVAYLFENYAELQATKTLGLAFELVIEHHADEDFIRAPASGKIKHICDHRISF